MAFPKSFQSYVPRTHCINSHVYGAVLITQDRQIAVVRGRQSGKWSFPKGHGCNYERPLDACIREVKEETGINLKGRKPDDEIRFRVGTYFVFYLEESMPLVPEDKSEVMEAMWVPFTRLRALTSNMDLGTFIRKVDMDSLANKIERERQGITSTEYVPINEIKRCGPNGVSCND